MGTTIGSAWHKFSDGGTEYISIAINKELLPLIITDEQTLTMFAVADKDKKSENAPNYKLVIDKRKKAE